MSKKCPYLILSYCRFLLRMGARSSMAKLNLQKKIQNKQGLFIYLFTYLFIYLFINLFICSFVRSFTHSFIYLLIYLLTYSFIFVSFLEGGPLTCPKKMTQALKMINGYYLRSKHCATCSNAPSNHWFGNTT